MKHIPYIGDNAIKNLAIQLSELAPKTVFLVRGNKSFKECGAEEAILPILTSLPCQVIEYWDFSVNPKKEEAEHGLSILLESKAECILSVGGGSVLDMAKMIRHYATEKGHHATLFAVPTTAGTGAEATHFAVVYVEGKKMSIEAEDIMPDMAFVYPPFTYSASPYLTACTGFDSLAQAIESYWAIGATPESREFAIKAMALLSKQLPQCVISPTKDLRRQIAEGAYWAGRAINISKTTAPHAFSYAFTSHCDYPHGHAVALTFPFFMEWNTPTEDMKKELKSLLGIDEKTSLKEAMEQLITTIGLGYRGCKENDLLDLLRQVNVQRLSNNPKPMTEEGFDKLYHYFNNKRL